MSAHEPDVIPQAELVELFRRRRPDAAAFRARVASRIAERESAGASEDREESPPGLRGLLRHEFLRRAAAFLPLDPTGGGTAKLVAAGIALPFLVLVASVGAFVAAGRSVVRASRGAEPARAEPVPLHRSFWGREIVHADVHRHLRAGSWIASLMQTLGMVVVLGAGSLGSTFVTEVLVALFLLAALALVLIVRGLGTKAQLTPTSAARYGFAILVGLFGGLFLFPNSRAVCAIGSDLGTAWPTVVLLAGIVVLAVRGIGASRWQRVGVVTFGLVVVSLNPFGLTLHGPASLRREVERGELSADLRGWEEVDHATSALRAVGGVPPPSESALKVLDRALVEDTDLHPTVWTAALHAGWMTTERWRQLAARPFEARALDRLLDPRAPVNPTPYYEYQVAMLVATRELPPVQRANLADRVEALWPRTGDHGALEKALALVRWLDHLGLADRVEARRDAVRALLVDHWWPGTGWSPLQRLGGFTPNPREFHTSMADDTYAAVVLMARFGVPEPIDVRAVRSYLRGESAAHFLVVPQPDWMHVTARAALLRLEREVGIPPRSFVSAIVGERLFVASVLLVGLCLLAVFSAPRPSRERSNAALP